MKIIDCKTEDPFALLKKRGSQRDAATEKIVAGIIADVRSRGDEALLETGRKFDSPSLQSLEVTAEELETATISERFLGAIRESLSRVRSFHQQQLEAITTGMRPAGNGRYVWLTQHGEPGTVPEGSFGQRLMPVLAAGVYVPGGKATYPSSVIMNAVPALVAGVQSVFVTTPAARDGNLNPAVLVALREVGVTRTFKVGGAAAIAALALGTETIPRVDKIVGPGNRFVNEAKRQLWGAVGLDGYAGPSEVGILADDSANARLAAADFLSQIEHAEDNAGFIVATSQAKVNEILAEVERQVTGTPREAIMRQAMADEAMVFIARDLNEACDVMNAIAPEHLSVAVDNLDAALAKIQNAGCVLLGEWTPESAGDFCLGPSHTLPTAGAARFGSPVNILDFLKVQSVSRLTREQLEPLIEVIEIFGEMEGFPTHGFGGTIRRELS